MPEGKPNPEPRETDPAQLAKLLELELTQKRASWQSARDNRRNLRLFSFFFLFLIIMAAAIAFYFLLSPDRIEDLKTMRRAAEPPPAATASP